MSTSAHPRAASVEETDAARAVVVGVDGSERNHAAVDYAIEEAAVDGRPLTLLAVLDDYTIPIPHHSVVPEDERQWRVLNRIADEVRRENPDVTVRRRVEFGGTVSTLVEQSADEELLVVGKRGLGAFARLMVGSTSVGVAGRAPVPVVIVPDGWRQSVHNREPVAVGLDPRDRNEATLRFAFTQAQRRGVGVTVVHALDISPSLVWDPVLGGPAYWEGRRLESVEKSVEPFRDEFPDVPVEGHDVHGHPSGVLLDESVGAQLLVLGRHHEGIAGFEIGSVARGVLHYAEVPVAVVPAV